MYIGANLETNETFWPVSTDLDHGSWLDQVIYIKQKIPIINREKGYQLPVYTTRSFSQYLGQVTGHHWMIKLVEADKTTHSLKNLLQIT